ncbi:MAG: sigma-70 family RNA polymerase sigma factor [Verrucomicrobia bacterium]|nr:sigma-70 family RNA polymerase sigma factor [Verrucomicrobiota bacterium]
MADGLTTAEQAQAMEAIMVEHETALLRYATRILHNASTAEDIVQNVFIKLFRLWNTGSQPTDRLKGWLYRVTHNEAVDHIRRESRLRDLHEREAAEAPEVALPTGHGRSADADRRAAVLQALAALHEREQQVVLLRLEEGLSYRQISQITGRSEGNVGNILHHAIKKLTDELKRQGAIDTVGVKTA